MNLTLSDLSTWARLCPRRLNVNSIWGSRCRVTIRWFTPGRICSASQLNLVLAGWGVQVLSHWHMRQLVGFIPRSQNCLLTVFLLGRSHRPCHCVCRRASISTCGPTEALVTDAPFAKVWAVSQNLFCVSLLISFSYCQGKGVWLCRTNKSWFDWFEFCTQVLFSGSSTLDVFFLHRVYVVHLHFLDI